MAFTSWVSSVPGLEGADFGENVGAHAAAGFGPFVVLLHQHRAHQADDGAAEDADDGCGGAAPCSAVPAGWTTRSGARSRGDGGEGQQVLAGRG
jgi:hypothetical protein